MPTRDKAEPDDAPAKDVPDEEAEARFMTLVGKFLSTKPAPKDDDGAKGETVPAERKPKRR